MHRIIEYINKIRQSPESVKQRVVLMWTIIFIIIIVLIWSLSFVVSVANKQTRDETLRLEAERLAKEAKQMAPLASTTESSNFPGLIPLTRDFVLNLGENISNGFWVIGDKLHK